MLVKSFLRKKTIIFEKKQLFFKDFLLDTLINVRYIFIQHVQPKTTGASYEA